MDVNLRKTATDTAYVVVGIGVLGLQQAQVKRRDAAARVSSLRRDARSTLGQGADTITATLKDRTGGCTAGLTGLGSTIGATVGDQVKGAVDTVGSQVKTGAEALSSQVKAGADVVSSQVKAGADAARTVDPRGLVEPVVGDLKVRVEPVIEQLRTIRLPGTVSAIPDQISKTIEVGRSRVQGVRGNGPSAVKSA